MAKINTVDFNNSGIEQLKKMKYGKDWPVVYILNNETEAYVGETLDASIRANQHLANDIRKNLKKMNIIADKTFNKSAILDLESFLINNMSADGLYILQNGNQGLKNHNYYERKMYEKKFKDIWIQLRSKGLVQNDLRVIENSDLFKYSPYKALNTEQYMIVNYVLSDLSKHIKKGEKASFIIEGGAGTGKTVLGIYLMKLLSEAREEKVIIEDEELDDTLSDIIEFHNSIDRLKIALVIPM